SRRAAHRAARAAPRVRRRPQGRGLMRRAWLVLVASGVLEAVWATSLGMSDGLTVLAPSIVFLASYLLSMWGLAVAMRSLPLSVSYAVWVAIGAVLTVAWAMTSGAEPVGVV